MPILLCLAAASLALAQPADLAPVLEPLRADARVPALAAVEVHAGAVTALGATGLRAQGSDAPVTTADRWHLGSCTKAMTATLCARLVERGLLDWDTTLADAFPDLAPAMHASWRGVTLRHLLTHRAGAPAQLERDGLWDKLWKMEGSPTDQRRLLLAGVTRHPTEHEPGSAFLYSNAGYAIAGHIAETLAQTPFEALIQRDLFQPLGITTAGFGAPGEEGRAEPDQPRGHRAGVPVPPGPKADNPPAIAPAGGVHMSLEDWARFIAAHTRGAASNPDRSATHLRAQTFDTLHAPGGDDEPRYAMGWLVAERDWADGVALTHAGSNTMWFAVVWIAPKKDLAVLVAVNAADPSAQRAADAAVGAVLKRDKP
jgi:CubicO group peptidase (beta-lactamase class C family)